MSTCGSPSSRGCGGGKEGGRAGIANRRLGCGGRGRRRRGGEEDGSGSKRMSSSETRSDMHGREGGGEVRGEAVVVLKGRQEKHCRACGLRVGGDVKKLLEAGKAERCVLEAFPAPWKVFRVICVAGSPID